eukprot:6976477-Pyramimonas_sp.AAC.1
MGWIVIPKVRSTVRLIVTLVVMSMVRSTVGSIETSRMISMVRSVVRSKARSRVRSIVILIEWDRSCDVDSGIDRVRSNAGDDGDSTSQRNIVITRRR